MTKTISVSSPLSLSVYLSAPMKMNEIKKNENVNEVIMKRDSDCVLFLRLQIVTLLNTAV